MKTHKINLHSEAKLNSETYFNRHIIHTRAAPRVKFILVDRYGSPKKASQKIKHIFFEINLFVSKKNVNETFHAFPIENPFNRKYGKRIFSFNYSLDKTTKRFQRHLQNPVKHLR